MPWDAQPDHRTTARFPNTALTHGSGNNLTLVAGLVVVGVTALPPWSWLLALSLEWPQRAGSFWPPEAGTGLTPQ
jgi:hypothetical protein